MSIDNGTKPRLLLVEDDPTSRQFMRAVLEALPCRVDDAGSLAEALAVGVAPAHDLWLLDANLPDGTGSELLAQLRSRQAPGARVRAIAHTADDSPELHARLMQAGFLDVLVKPLSAASLGRSVRHWLGQRSPDPSMRIAETAALLPLWDHAAALAALNGSHSNLAALRQIFLVELVRQHVAIMGAIAAGELPAATHQLHQLKASSGFVGASRLQAATVALDEDLLDPARAQQFETVLRETVSAA